MRAFNREERKQESAQELLAWHRNGVPSQTQAIHIGQMCARIVLPLPAPSPYSTRTPLTTDPRILLISTPTLGPPWNGTSALG